MQTDKVTWILDWIHNSLWIFFILYILHNFVEDYRYSSLRKQWCKELHGGRIEGTVCIDRELRVILPPGFLVK